jgi:hypothetical protein
VTNSIVAYGALTGVGGPTGQARSPPAATTLRASPIAGSPRREIRQGPIRCWPSCSTTAGRPKRARRSQAAPRSTRAALPPTAVRRPTSAGCPVPRAPSVTSARSR